MDFTFLFIIILMLLAVKSGLTIVAIGLALVLFVTSKSKYLLLAAVVGLLVVGAAYFNISGLLDFSNSTTWIILGGLFLVMVILAKKDSDTPGNAEAYSPYPQY